jgi:hypothetical protein
LKAVLAEKRVHCVAHQGGLNRLAEGRVMVADAAAPCGGGPT